MVVSHALFHVHFPIIIITSDPFLKEQVCQSISLQSTLAVSDALLSKQNTAGKDSFAFLCLDETCRVCPQCVCVRERDVYVCIMRDNGREKHSQMHVMQLYPWLSDWVIYRQAGGVQDKHSVGRLLTKHKPRRRTRIQSYADTHTCIWTCTQQHIDIVNTI